MSKALEFERWKSLHNMEILERRVYKNGAERYYIYSSFRNVWDRVENSWGEHLTKNEETFVKPARYKQIRQEKDRKFYLKVLLRLAQNAGGFRDNEK